MGNAAHHRAGLSSIAPLCWHPAAATMYAARDSRGGSKVKAAAVAVVVVARKHNHLHVPHCKARMRWVSFLELVHRQLQHRGARAHQPAVKQVGTCKHAAQGTHAQGMVGLAGGLAYRRLDPSSGELRRQAIK